MCKSYVKHVHYVSIIIFYWEIKIGPSPREAKTLIFAENIHCYLRFLCSIICALKASNTIIAMKCISIPMPVASDTFSLDVVITRRNSQLD